jgi:hypothetical protein
MRTRRKALLVVFVVTLALSGCASDPTWSEEYQALQAELSAARDQLPGLEAALSEAETEVVSVKEEVVSLETALSGVEAERDAAEAELGEVAAMAGLRREMALATLEAITSIVDDPSAFGTEAEVLDELMTHVTPDAIMDDDVFGAMPMRAAWRATLFGNLDASIRSWHQWVSEDGSQGGVLSTWSGTNFVGEPFELSAVSIIRFDENGKETYEFVVYPYEDDVVREAITGPEE